MKHIKSLFILFTICLSILLVVTACNNQSAQKPDNSQTPLSQLNDYTTPYNDDNKQPNVVSYFSTPILDKSSGRINNLEIASSKIDGCIVEPGETFSFNEVVGRASAENGYEKAIVLDKNGNKKMGYGGICQVSSTLYNAAKKVGMKIEERHSHEGPVGYLRQGDDAAINYGIGDFKFKNNKKYSIKIAAKVEGKKRVIVSLEKVNEDKE